MADNSRDFPGTNGNVIVVADPTGMTLESAYTIGMWVNPEAFGGDGNTLVKWGPNDDTSGARGFRFYVNGTGKFRYNGATTGGPTTLGLSTGSWQRVGFTRAGAGVANRTCYLNGSSETLGNQDPETALSAGDTFGNRGVSSAPLPFNGKMAWMFFLQGVVLSAANIDAYLNDPQGLYDAYGPSGSVTANALKLLWPMQCDDGTTETDKSGVGNNGTYVGTVALGSADGPSPTTAWDPCAAAGAPLLLLEGYDEGC